MEDNKTNTVSNQTNMAGNEIIFRMGEETGIVIEKTQEQFEHSLFKEQYRQTFSIMDSIIKRSTPEKGMEIDDKMSNIIVFCGDRGEGKTSALETVRGILSDKNIYANAKAAQLITDETRFDISSFKVLNMVDPAFFDDKHNLMELLVGQMYADILKDDRAKACNDEYNPCRLDVNVVERNNLIQYFHQVRDGLRIIHKPSEKSAYDNLEEIDELAAGIELKEKVHQLLKCYAKYFKKERVLICIDDLDLNATEGYTMAEEIRKYLSSPASCVVLMAVKIEQMIEVVQSYLRENLSEIVSNDTIKEMAIRYVMKLIPESRRILMPSGGEIVEKTVILERDKDDKEKFSSVKEAVVRYIYRKTGFIFVNGRNISPIVPHNLRSVRLLIGMLWSMPNAKDKEGIDFTSNKEIFKTYFYNTWTKNLSIKDMAFVLSLAHNEDLVSINKSVVMHLSDIILSGKEDAPSSPKIKDRILKAILNPMNAIQNISFGDVMYVLNYIETHLSTTENKNLIFFLRAFYSIKLYDMYNLISESESNLFPDETDGKVSIYKYDSQIQKLNLLQRVINGSYFTYEAGSLMPSDSRKTPRDKRIINGKELIESFKTLTKDSPINQWKKCEFFALTTTYPVYAGSEFDYDRTLTSRSYFDNFKESNNYIAFDALAIFYSIINIKQTYQRWNDIYKGGTKDFYQDSLKRKGSLLNALFEICAKEHSGSPQTELSEELHAFISEAIVRVSEVQLAIVDNLVSQRGSARTGGNLFNIYNSYQYIRDLGIELYPIKEGKKSYEMNFWFLKPVIDFLSDAKQIKEEEFNRIFQIEITNNTIIKNLERVLGGNILGLSATASETGFELRERINKLNDVDLLEDIDWDMLFENEQKYSRKDVIAILSQSSIYEKIRGISSAIKTREDSIKIATDRAIVEVSKIFERFTTTMEQQYKQIEMNVDTIANKLNLIEEKKKTGRSKRTPKAEK